MILRQSTAVDLLIGPFVDETDGFTAEAGLTINASDVLLSKNGQALTLKADVTAAANDSGAYYNCELDTTDTNIVGTLVVAIHVAGARPVTQTYQVIEEAIYDALYVAAADGFNASGEVSLIAATQTQITNTLADTNELQGDWENGGRLDLLLDALITEIDTATSEPSQGAPGVSEKRGLKIDYLYKAWRNKCTQTATTYSLYADNGSTIDQDSTLSSVGGTFTSGVKGTGA